MELVGGRSALFEALLNRGCLRDIHAEIPSQGLGR